MASRIALAAAVFQCVVLGGDAFGGGFGGGCVAVSVGGMRGGHCSFVQMRNFNNLGLRGGGRVDLRPVSPHMIFDGLFGKKEDPSKETPGKFVRHGQLENGGSAYGPLGIVCAGLGDDELEVLAERVEQVLSGPEGEVREIPIAVLGKGDMDDRITLADVLGEMQDRNLVLPDEPLELDMPLVLLSGLTPIQLSASIKAIMNSGIRGGKNGEMNQPMCAMAVPKAMSKTICQLVEEIEGDARLNTAKPQ